MKKSLPHGSNLVLLHAIRGLAALYVVVFHAKFILWSGGREFISRYPVSGWSVSGYVSFALDMFFSAGSQMVMIFFVLSGFFIAMSFQNIKGSPLDKIKYFYAVRLVRIYVPYIASMLLGIAVLLFVAQFAPELYVLQTGREFNTRLITAYSDLGMSNFAKGLMFCKNKEYIGFNYAYWSLLYEAIFYLAVPFIDRFRQWYLVVSTVLFLCGIFMLNTINVSSVIARFMFEYNFYFALGQAIFIYREELSKYILMKRGKIISILAAVVFFLSFNMLALFQKHFFADVLASFTAAILILLVLNYDLKDSRLLKLVKKLGEMSYSLYLVHVPTLVLCFMVMYKITGKIIFYGHTYYIGIIASLLTGWIFYKGVEKPSLLLINKIKKTFFYKPVPVKLGIV